VNSLTPSFPSRLQLPLTERLTRAAQGGPTEGGAAATSTGSFTGLLRDGVLQVNSMQHDATSQINELLTGGDVNQAEVFTAVQKADMAFRMLVQVRNKLMAAYEEINNIRI
jgi:flagellar hook-basal body complex protein FliE